MKETRTEHDAGVSTAECDHDARYKWKKEFEDANFDSLQNVREVSVDPRVGTDVAAYIRSEDSDLLVLDFDDVRCAETGEVHPSVWMLLSWLAPGGCYVAPSDSKSGLHAFVKYDGDIPGDYVSQILRLDTEPWRQNDDVPACEIHDRRGVTVETGERLVGTPDRPGELDDGALREAIKALSDRGLEKTGSSSADYDGEYDPDSVGSSADVDDLPYSLVQRWAPVTGRDGGEWLTIDPPYRQSGGTSVHFNENEEFFYDHKFNESFHVFGLMATIAGVTDKPWEPRDSQQFIETVKFCNDHGANIELDSGGDGDAPDGREAGYEPFLGLKPIAQMDQYERRRVADHYGLEPPTVEDARERTREGELEAIENGWKGVFNAPTGTGKTFNPMTTNWRDLPELTGGKAVVVATENRETRDEKAQQARDAGLDVRVLRGRKDTCEVAAGAHDPGNGHGNPALTINDEPASKFIDLLCGALNAPYSSIHEYLERVLDVEMPCEHGEHTCPSKTQLEGITDDNDNPNYDVVVCCHPWLLVPSLRLHKNIFIDERPDYSLGLGVDVPVDLIRTSITEFIRWSDVPFDSYEELRLAGWEGYYNTQQTSLDGGTSTFHKDYDCPGVIAPAARDAAHNVLDDALDHRTALNYAEGKDADFDAYDYDEIVEMARDLTDYHLHKSLDTDEFIMAALGGTGKVSPPRGWFIDKRVHSLAPAMAQCLWKATPSSGLRSATVNYNPPRLDADAMDADAWNAVKVRVSFDGNEPNSVRQTPDFTLARSVIGLDATAEKEYDPMWELNTGLKNIETRMAMDRDERTMYRRYSRGLQTVQVDDVLNPATSEHYIGEGMGKRIRCSIEAIVDEFGERAGQAVTSKALRDHVDGYLSDAGIEDPEIMTYGSEKGRDDFADDSEERNIGIVVGAIDPGDQAVMNALAELNLDARPATKECPVCDGSGEHGSNGYCDTCEGEGFVREKGRLFSGKDAEEARKVLESVRSAHIQQAIGRWARDAEDENDNATVFVLTNAAPEGTIDAKVPGPQWLTTDNQREVLTLVRDAEGAITSREIAAQVDQDRSSVNKTLKQAREKGIIDFVPGAGRGGAFLYTAEDGVCVDGEVTLGESVRPAYRGTNTYFAQVESYPDRAANVEDENDADSTQVSLSTFPATLDPPS